MCGIVGLIHPQGRARRAASSLARATDRLAHRGPDDRGEFYDGPVGLGFRRLSILDLSPSGHQPMTSADGRWTLVYNGEIYNFVELRRDLEERGVRLRSDGDTEVLLEALSTWGPDCLGRMNGMWAFLAWDARERVLFAARDPWGIKPMYLCDWDGGVAFASEIKALRELGCDLGGLDPVAARRFMLRGLLDSDERTFFERVRRLEPGLLYSFRADGTRSSRPYPDGTECVDVPDPADEVAFVEAFRETFLDSVRIRLRADVSVGTSLSGGLDSTAITGATSRLLPGQRVSVCRHGFTASFPEYDESRYIEPLVAQAGVEWHVTQASDDLLAAKTEAFFRAHDEPVHSLAPLAGFLVMELAARSGVRVLLNGQGSDELLAGYPSYAIPHVRDLIAHGRLRLALREARAEGGSLAAGARTLLRATSMLVPGAGQVRLRSPDAAAEGLLAGALREEATSPGRRARTLQQALQQSVTSMPLPLYLRIEDVNSSAFSLEARLPFLDPRIVAFARTASPSLLRRDGLNKVLLRRILPGLVPEIVWKRRDKMGFPVPHGRWFRGPLREMFLDVLDENGLRRRGWVRSAEATRMRDRFLAAEGAPPAPLLRLFLLESWACRQLGAA